ncbi:MAG: Dabb family protein [Anaerolineales bacterium]|nr:Dabb family protein [Anaerolineales bacterium]
MITHIVLIKLKQPSAENMATAVNKIRAMADKIPILQSLEVGQDVIRSTRSYDIGLIARFNNLDDLQTYQTHPVHVPVLEHIRNVMDSVIAVDYES